eukprot:TRINITY_DN3274_c0_g1_i1.p1 TRINITY_DN3274_c0_g1~~TRINITY_DN3274_c0_g1_i1.p1  ORF type:complete len:103 (-),score=28.60 TRINITY_DN3274_c0_g1_i1:189-497(-)
MMMLNYFTIHDLIAASNEDSSLFTNESFSARLKIWFFFWFSISFGALGCSLWIFVSSYLMDDASGDLYPGLCVVLQSAFTLLVTLFMLFARRRNEDGEYSAF